MAEVDPVRVKKVGVKRLVSPVSMITLGASLTTRVINAVKSAQQCATKGRGDSIWWNKYVPKLHTKVASARSNGPGPRSFEADWRGRM